MTPPGDRAPGRGTAALPWGVILWLTAVVLWATYTPFLSRPEPWHLTLAPPTSRLEVVGNFLLFLPLAFVLGRGVAGRNAGRRALVWLGLGLAGACALVEGGQTLVDGRIVSPYDFLLNLGGAVLGLGLGVSTIGSDDRVRGLTRRVFLGSLGVAYLGILGLLLLRVPAARAGLELRGWEEDYRVRVADEVGGDRAYRGEVSDARICAGNGAREVCAAAGASEAVRRDLVRVAEETQSVRLEARVRSVSSRQFGPTRIVTFSSGPGLRNATLGQSGDDLVLRLRTPMAGPNGTRVHYRLRNGVPPGASVTVAARYRDGTVELRVGEGEDARTRTVHGSRRWSLAWLVAGEVEPGNRGQLLWAGLAGCLVVLFPLGLAAGRILGRRSVPFV